MRYIAHLNCGRIAIDNCALTALFDACPLNHLESIDVKWCRQSANESNTLYSSYSYMVNKTGMSN
jgi:hypothetical protein